MAKNNGLPNQVDELSETQTFICEHSNAIEERPQICILVECGNSLQESHQNALPVESDLQKVWHRQPTREFSVEVEVRSSGG
jgi:hypothetical protein